MKKFLSALAAIGITATGATSVVACSGTYTITTNDDEIKALREANKELTVKQAELERQLNNRNKSAELVLTWNTDSKNAVVLIKDALAMGFLSEDLKTWNITNTPVCPIGYWNGIYEIRLVDAYFKLTRNSLGEVIRIIFETEVVKIPENKVLRFDVSLKNNSAKSIYLINYRN